MMPATKNCESSIICHALGVFVIVSVGFVAETWRVVSFACTMLPSKAYTYDPSCKRITRKLNFNANSAALPHVVSHYDHETSSIESRM